MLNRQIINVILANDNSFIELIEMTSKHISIVKVLKNISYGINGYTLKSEKVEGDGKTPLGVYNLGKSFGIEKNTNSKYPYKQITENSYWVDDSNSIYYNKWVELNDSILVDWNSAEHLIDYSKQYKKGIIIEYNTNEIKKNKGSAIFVHLKGETSHTSGCIAIDEEDMNLLLSWLEEKKKPIIKINSK